MRDKRRSEIAAAAVAAGIIVLAVGLRIALIAQGWPGPADSDESTMGLMARHIAYSSAHPLLYYGQLIVGPAEAYAGAAVFQVASASVFALRLGIVLLFAPFLACMYALTRLLYGKAPALGVLGLLSLGSGEMLGAQVVAAGHAETPLYGAAIMLLATAIALAVAQRPGARHSWGYGAAYGGWGLLVGLAIWCDPLVVPFATTAGLLLLRTFRQGASKVLAVWALLGLVLGSGPFLAGINGQMLAQPAVASTTVHALTDHPYFSRPLPSWLNLVGTVMVSLPVATGANALWPVAPGIDFGWHPAQSYNVQSSWPGTQTLSFALSPATISHALWGLAFIGLGVVAFRREYRRAHALAAPARPSSWRRRRATTIYLARMALLGAAGLTLLVYLVSPTPVLFPWAGKRYLVGLLVAFPAVLWPLVRRVPAGRWAPPVRAARHGLQAGGVAILAGAFVAGVIQTWMAVPVAQAHWRAQDALVANLLELGATRIYGEYWTCNRLAFQTQEQIRCSVINEEMQRGLDRYYPYCTEVDAALHPWYVFPRDSPQDLALAAQLAAQPAPYHLATFAGYNAYQFDPPLLTEHPVATPATPAPAPP